MKVALGSKNAAKVEATRHAFHRCFQDVEVIAFDVESGVSAQPVAEETFTGAVNRAWRALKRAADCSIQTGYGVGIEAGIIRLGGLWYAWGVVCVIDSSGIQGMGTTPAFQLPNRIVECMEGDCELGAIMEQLSGDSDIRQHRGAVGLFTRDYVTRTELFESGVLAALAPHLTPEWYSK